MSKKNEYGTMYGTMYEAEERARDESMRTGVAHIVLLSSPNASSGCGVWRVSRKVLRHHTAVCRFDGFGEIAYL